MPTRRSLVVVACAAFVAVESWLALSENPHASVGVGALWGLFFFLVAVRVVRSLVSRKAPSLRQTITPGVQGLGEVQDMYLGRKPVPPVTYVALRGVETEQPVAYTDPLDDPVWVIRFPGALSHESVGTAATPGPVTGAS